MSSRSPSPRHNSSYPDRRNARKSISLSPIRTESGANLRTANWTKMRFRAPGESRGAFQQSNWNQRNYNNYNNYNNYRGNYNPRGRWQNRGRGNYRGNWNQRGGGYVPKRRNYSRNYDSRSRSRSYSRSRSRERSYSSGRRDSYSRSRSRSLSKSRSRSRDRPQMAPTYKLSPKVEDKPVSKPNTAFFREAEEISKKTLEPGKVGLSKWDSPDKKYDDDTVPRKSGYAFGGQQAVEKSAFKTNMEFKSFPTYEQATGGGQVEQEGHSAAQVQQMMEKTALASVARHEKSLMKIRKAQGKMKKVSKSDSSDDNLDENEILQMMKSVKKAKKKKNKNKLSKKLTKAKLKKMKMAAASSSSDSDDKSSENSSDSSSQEAAKKRAMAHASRKKKHAKVKPGSMSPQSKKMRPSDDTNVQSAYGTPTEIRKDLPVQSGTPFMPQTITQTPGNQPVMLMAPGLGDMRFLGGNGQPMNLIQLAVPGPDGQMQLLQIPSMGRDGQQPIVMLPPTAIQQPQQPVATYPTTMSTVSLPQPVTVPKPVPPPAPPGEPPTHSKPPPPESNQNQYDDEKQAGQFADVEKELTEKQKRRKEVIRTRLWPRPATSTWDEEGGELQEEAEKTEKSIDNGKRHSDSWPKPATSLADNNMTSFQYNSESIGSHAKQDRGNRENIPGFSPDAKSKTEGQKIPTLSRGSMLSQPVDNVKETIDELPRKKPEILDQESISEGLPTSSEGSTYHQPQLVAYPSHITQHAYEPVYVGSQPSVASSATLTRSSQGEFAKGKDSKWTAATEEFIRDRQPQKKSKYDAPVESSSDEDFTTTLMTKKARKQAYEAQMMEIQDEEMAYQEEEAKKMKKKKKNKKDRKDSIGTEEATSPVMKEKKRKKKKKNKEKDYENNSDAELSKKSRKQEKKHQEKNDETEEDDLVRRIPSDLPLSHIRGLVVRQEKEGAVSIFNHIDFSKLASESEFADEKDSYEDQFVSLFGMPSGESKPAKTSPLNMSKKALKKIKVAPAGPRTVAHMTEISLSERIAAILEANRAEEKTKSVSQKVSVNLASLSRVDDKYEKLKSPIKSRSTTPHNQRHRSRTSSYGSESSRSRSRSRSSRSARSLPKAYSAGDRSLERHRDSSRSRSRSRDGDRRPYRNNNRGYFQPYNNRYNQRFQYRGRGNFVNYRARGRFFHRGFNNNRGYNNYNNYNNNYRGRGYYNNNNRDQNQWRNRRQSYRSDEEERRDRRRSRSYSISDRRTGSSGSSDEDDRREPRQEREEKNAPQAHEAEQTYPSGEGAGGNQQFEENMKVRRKSPDQWTHDMFEQHEKEE